ncbi:MAG: hypothetical protein LBB75_07920, partial [Oscillospiraceae bacterium]|nr:hypothetical protein [Oscillospiraceae bacterium]
MAEFLAWPWYLRALTTLLLALCVLSQTLAAVLSFYTLKRRCRAVPELCACALVLSCSLLYGQAIRSCELGLLAPLGYGALRVNAQGRAWAWVFLGAMLLSLARSIYICLLRRREIATGISALSVKNAIDSLRSGVLFSEP